MKTINLPDIVTSKKAQVTVIGILITVLAESFGIDLSQDQLVAIIALISSYVVGQGISDNGKEAEKVKQNGGVG